MAQAPIHPDKLRLDALMERAANATRRAAPGKQLRYARTLGISESRASRHMRSDDPYTPAVRLLAAVDALASGDATSALPLLTEAFAVALEALRDRPVPELEARLREYERRRVERQAELDRARNEEFQSGAQYGSAAVDDARVALAEVDLEIAAIRRVLREIAQREDR